MTVSTNKHPGWNAVSHVLIHDSSVFVVRMQVYKQGSTDWVVAFRGADGSIHQLRGPAPELRALLVEALAALVAGQEVK